jgi:hypothetical protein
MLLAFLVVRKITPWGLPCFFDTSLRLFSDQPITVIGLITNNGDTGCSSS